MQILCMDWKDVAALLGEYERSREVEANYPRSCKECCRSIILSWAKSGCGQRHPFSWDGLYQLLIDMDYVDTANRLLLARSHLYFSVIATDDRHPLQSRSIHQNAANCMTIRFCYIAQPIRTNLSTNSWLFEDAVFNFKDSCLRRRS